MSDSNGAFVRGALHTRHGDTLDHSRSALMAHGLALSAPHDVQGFGMPDGSISTDDMKRKVHAAT